MQTQTKSCTCFTKINSKCFSDRPELPLIPKTGSLKKNKNCSYDCQYEMVSYNYYQHQNL